MIQAPMTFLFCLLLQCLLVGCRQVEMCNKATQTCCPLAALFAHAPWLCVVAAAAAALTLNSNIGNGYALACGDCAAHQVADCHQAHPRATKVASCSKRKVLLLLTCQCKVIEQCVFLTTYQQQELHLTRTSPFIVDNTDHTKQLHLYIVCIAGPLDLQFVSDPASVAGMECLLCMVVQYCHGRMTGCM